MPRSAPGWRVLAAALLLAACARDAGLRDVAAPATAIAGYTVVIRGAPLPEIAGTAEEALAVYRLRDEGAPSRAFLRRRAEDDLATIARLLRSRGYYESTATVELSPEAAGPTVVTFRIAPGARYTLAAHRFDVLRGPGREVPLDAALLGSPVGGPADAALILSAEDAALGLLRREGFAYARFRDRDALADRTTKTVAVVSNIVAGRRYVFGRVAFAGVTAVGEEYLRSYLPWKEGETFDRAKLRDYRERLAGTGLFLAVSAEPPEKPPKDAELPVTVTAEERPPRTIRAGLRYDTDEGPVAYAALSHRNILGRNETATLAAEAGLERQVATLDIGVPQFLAPGRTLLASLEARNETLPAYAETGATLTLGIERELSPRLTIGYGGLLEASSISDSGVPADVVLAGIPAFAARDTSDDLLDPTRGWRLRLEATPFAGDNDARLVGFLTLDATASGYWALTEDRRTVLALRGRIATILAEDLGAVPATRRLYSGGGGSVRGYAIDSIGGLDALGRPVGGLSALEAGIELRTRFRDAFGGVLFIDAGSVSPSSFPDFDDGVQLAAGLGLRYFSPVGPVRADVGVPLNPRDTDDLLQFYVSIGQAF